MSLSQRSTSFQLADEGDVDAPLTNQRYSLFSIFKIVWKVYPIYLVIFIGTVLLGGLFEPFNLLVMRQFIDQVLTLVQRKAGFAPVIPLFLLILLLQFYNYFQPTVNQYLGVRLKHKVKQHFLSLIIDKIARLEYHYIENRETADLIHRVKKGAETRIQESFTHLSKIIAGVVSIIGLFVIIWQAGPWIALAILLIIIFTTYLAYRCGTRTFAVSVAFTRLEREMEYFESVFTDRKIAAEIKLFRAFDYLKKLYRRSFEEDIEKYIEMQTLSRPNFEVLLGGIGYVLLFATYIILLFPLADQVISIGFYIAAMNALTRLVAFITKTVPESLQYLFQSHLYWQEVETFFALQEKKDVVKDDVSIRSTTDPLTDFQQIKFENVYFKYPNSDQYILKGVDFTLQRGRHYAIVGQNGAGKSTIIKLLTGLYQVDQGQITIDGININQFSADTLVNLFSVVFQDFGRYNISVRDHIQLSRTNQEPDLTRMDEIAARLGFLKTIQQLPEGYDTQLGKLTADGIDLSGGEWQKLALCRALYSNAAIRILDEPTAALDPAAETRLYQLFEDSLTEGASTIFISHRLGSTKLADEIILIADGVVKEQGSHAELVQQNGLYKRMFDSQRIWYSQTGGQGKRKGDDEIEDVEDVSQNSQTCL